MIPEEHLCALQNAAKRYGATDTIPIAAKDIVVENRTILKCIFGCNGYGSKVCPPYIPTVDEFRKMLTEYEDALIIKWRSHFRISRDISENFTKYGISTPRDPITKDTYDAISRHIMRDRAEHIQPGALEVEKCAWSLGYYTALATFPGRCAWCTPDESGTTEDMTNACRHPTRRRPCLMGLGIRLDKTLERIGMPITPFPLDDEQPMAYCIVLID